MYRKFINMKNNTLLKNVMILVSGTAAAQIIAMILSPIITRLYGPEAFGVMGTFNAVVTIVAPISALTYPIAIVLPEKSRDAKGLIKVSLYITFILALFSLILILFLKDSIADVFNLKEIKSYLYFIPFVILFASIMQIMEQWLIRTKQFSVNAKVTLTQSFIENIGKVLIGLFYPLAKVLVFFTIIANGLKAILMYIYSRNRPKVREENIKKHEIKKLIIDYKEFPLYRAPEVFLNAISTGLPIILLTVFSSPQIAGFYTIVRTVMSLPSQLIGKAVGDVFYPRIAEAFNNGENIRKLIGKATFGLGIIGIVPFGIIILIGPQIFSFVFGHEWVTSGEYARWIAVWSYFAFMNRPSVVALPVLKAQRFHLIYTVFMLISRLGVLSLGFILYNSDQIAIAFYGISGAVLNFGLIFLTLQISTRKQKNY